MTLRFSQSRMAPTGLCATRRKKSASLSTPQSTPWSSISSVFLGFQTTDKLLAMEIPACVNDWLLMLFKIKLESLNGHLCLSVGRTTLEQEVKIRGPWLERRGWPRLQMGKEEVVDNWGNQISVLKILGIVWVYVSPLLVCSLVILQRTLQVTYFYLYSIDKDTELREKSHLISHR